MLSIIEKNNNKKKMDSTKLKTFSLLERKNLYLKFNVWMVSKKKKKVKNLLIDVLIESWKRTRQLCNSVFSRIKSLQCLSILYRKKTRKIYYTLIIQPIRSIATFSTQLSFLPSKRITIKVLFLTCYFFFFLLLCNEIDCIRSA